MKRFFGGNQWFNRDFEPGALYALFRMIKSGQVAAFRRRDGARLRYIRHQPQAFNSSQVFARHGCQHALDVSQGVPWHLVLVLVLDLNRHCLN